jgi:general secretion pathway protein F
MRHYSTALPRYALEAVVRAEDKGRLGSVLPVLCEVLSVDANPHNRFRAALFYPLMQLVITLAMLSGLLIFIVPKFGKMFDEMLPGVPLHDSMAALMALANASGLVFTSFWLLICGIAFVQVARPVIRNNEFMLSVAERLLGHVPFAGPILRSRSDLDLYQAMAALTATGIDIGEAAEQAAQVVRSPGAARRLIRFFRESQGGMPWVDAWQVAVEPSGLSEFLVRNAAVREDPASGFARAAQWEGNDLEHRYAALARWIEPLGILLNAFLVGITVYGLLGALFTLIREIA